MPLVSERNCFNSTDIVVSNIQIVKGASAGSQDVSCTAATSPTDAGDANPPQSPAATGSGATAGVISGWVLLAGVTLSMVL